MSEARLYLNIGNTGAQLGVWVEGRWQDLTRQSGAAALGVLRDLGQMQAFAQRELTKVTACFSTANTTVWEAGIEAVLGLPLAVLGRDFRAEIQTLYHNPKQLGQDRAANILAAIAAKHLPCLILDAGTCLTADLVDAEGVHLGGAIAPGLPASMGGIVSSAGHLARSLPKLPLSHTPELGLDTKENLAAGLSAALLGTGEVLVRHLRQMTKPQARVILTGGDAEFLARGLEVKAEIRPDLTLEGLRLAHERAGCP